MYYLEELLKIRNYTFDSIIELNRRFLPQRYYSYPWTYPGLDHGRAVLTTEEQCCAYIAAYGNMHQAKINEVLDKISINNIAEIQNNILIIPPNILLLLGCPPT